MRANIKNIKFNYKFKFYAIYLIVTIYSLCSCSNGWLRKDDPDIMAWMNGNRSSLAREKDWLDCGGDMNGYVHNNKNEVMGCMKMKGYNFIGSCKYKHATYCGN